MGVPLREAASGPLQGNWSATRWEYRGLDHANLAVDVVCDMGASVTLSFGSDAYVLTYDAPPPARRGSEGGAFVVRGDLLELHPTLHDTRRAIHWRVSDDILTLRDDEATYDFDDSHRDARAALVAVLVRV